MIISITNEAFSKLKYFIAECPAEISGFGKVREIIDKKDKEFLIHDVEILKQEVGDAHATIDEEAMAKFLFEKTKKGESTKEYRLWWHSHNDFSSFFSSIDTATIDDSTEFPYLISLVGNKEGKFEIRYDEYKPERITIDRNEIKLIPEDPDGGKLRKYCIKEIKEKVKVLKPVERFKNFGYKGYKGWENFSPFKPKKKKRKHKPYIELWRH